MALKGRLVHTMLHVADMERTLAFYCGLFGMQVLVARENPATGHRNVFVGHGPAAPQIEFTSYAGREEYAKGEAFGHVAFEVEDCVQACAVLAGQGVRVTREPRQAPSGAMIAFIEDPDGYAIELIQPPPGA